MNSPSRSRLNFALVAILVTTFGPAVHALDLVRDGRPVATIVVAETPPPAAPPPVKGKRPKKATEAAVSAEIRAARVLAEWIKKITDAELPIATRAAAGTSAIFVGQAALAAGLKLDDIDSASREGLRIVADDRRVLIAGQKDEATLKAVCRFLEELGCRYLMDNALGEIYPRTRTLSVGRLNLAEKPGLIGRNPKGPSWRSGLWKEWNGAGGETYNHSHSWGRYVKESLFEEHPGYFALGSDGQRKRGGWLCTSNPALREHFAREVIAAIRSGTKHPSLSPTDGRGYCQCEPCRAQDDPNSLEPSSGTVAVSNRYVDFFDAVARIVAKAEPGSVLTFYCYADYTQPPTVKRQLSPNLCAMIAPIRYCRLHEIGHPGCAGRVQQLEMVDAWAGVASRLGYYNYMYNLADATLPFFKYTACAKEFPHLRAKGLDYMTIEVLSNWHIYGPQIYLSLRLAYDPGADAHALMEDYWLKFYGPKAAPHMKAYWMGIDSAIGKLNTHAGCFFGLQQIYTPEFLRTCEAHLRAAAGAARGDSGNEQRVALHTEGFRSAVEYRQICAALNRADFAGAKATYDRMVERLNALGKQGLANPEYATAYLRRFLSKPIEAGLEASAAPNRVVSVLADPWRFRFDEADTGLADGFAKPELDDSRWDTVRTQDITLDAQGHDRNSVLWYRTRFAAPAAASKLSLFFGEVDGATEVFLNGRKLPLTPWQPAPGTPAKGKSAKAPAPVDPGAPAKPRSPFQADLTGAIRPGDNVLAVRVDHRKITELSLGGILRPVVLLARP